MIMKRKWGIRIGNIRSSRPYIFPAHALGPGRRLLQKTSFLREVSRALFFTIPLRSSHVCAHGNTYFTGLLCSSFPTGEANELSCPCEKGMEAVSSPWGGMESGRGQEAPVLDLAVTTRCRSRMDFNTWHHRLFMAFSEYSWANGKVNIGFVSKTRL